MRRTKIICTIGPASNRLEVIREMVRAGMDMARLNYAHGTHQTLAQAAQQVRQAVQEQGRYVALLQDLAGPKIRTGRLRERRQVQLRAGDRLWLTPEDIVGTSSRVSVSYDRLASDVRKNQTILLDDGLIELRVLGTSGREVETEIIQGGRLGEQKGVNLPGTRLRVEALTPKDREDLDAGIKLGVDYVALSFVRSAKDVRQVRDLLGKRKSHIPVLAKLEKPEAVENLDEILAASDGVMVARGDLGVEAPPESVPLMQKKIIQRAASARVPVAIATQMLESMTASLRPTRAEASDVANAIFDGADAVMLAEETAIGLHPVQALEMMARIAEQAEQAHQERNFHRRGPALEIGETICESVVHAAHRLNVKAILAFTRSGATARLISKYRPGPPVYAFCHDDCIARRAALYWGVTPFALAPLADEHATLKQAEGELLRRRLIARDDILAVVSGIPSQPGGTNQMKLVRAGSIGSTEN